MSSSSEDSEPPLYHITCSVDSFAGHESVRLERCPLCNKKNKAFYCKDCVRNGNFYHSRMNVPERFAEKKLRWFHLRRGMLEQDDGLARLHGTKTRATLLAEKTEEVRERVQLLRKVISTCRSDVTALTVKTIEVYENNAKKKKGLPIFHKRLSKLLNILEQTTTKNTERRELLSSAEKALETVVKENVGQLTRYIFPITEVQAAWNVDADPDRIDTASAIAEASHTTYVKGRWVYTDTSHGTQYQVVGPLLPGSGDYSAYNNMVTGGTDGESGDAIEIGERVVGHSISAGLTYMTQLVNILAFYLNVTLPKKLCYSEFCLQELTELQFTRRVAKLNVNTIYLCMCQRVDSERLRPAHTARNLLALIDTQNANFGRHGSFQVMESLLESIEEVVEGIQQGEVTDGSDDDDQDNESLSAEWEAVPNLPPLDNTYIGARQPAGQDVHMLSDYSQMGIHNGANVPGGIVSSAAASVMSLWKGFGWQQK